MRCSINQFVSLSLACLLVGMGAGCGDRTESAPPIDAGDTGQDLGADAVTDVPDAGDVSDQGGDAGGDGGLDVEADADADAFDAPIDSQDDSALDADLGLDANDEASADLDVAPDADADTAPDAVVDPDLASDPDTAPDADADGDGAPDVDADADASGGVIIEVIVEGLPPAETIDLLLNEVEELTVDNGNHAFEMRLDVDSFFFVVVRQMTIPDDYACGVYGGDGTVMLGQPPVEVICGLDIEVLYAPGGDLWGFFVRDNGADIWSATGSPCAQDVEDEFRYEECIHAGELRQAVVPQVGSCEDVASMGDSLAAFEWECYDADGPVVVRSRGLRPNAGLGDLIDTSVPEWRPIELQVSDLDGRTYRSPPGVWWRNAVVEASIGGGLVTLSSSGTIYTLDTDATGRVQLTADGVGFLTGPDATLTGSAGGPAVLINGDYSWVEVSIDGKASSTVGVQFQNSDISVLHLSSITTTASNGVIFESGQGNLASNLDIDGGGGTGVLFLSDYDTARDVRVASPSTAGVRVEVSASRNRVADLSVSSAPTCLRMTSGTRSNIVDGADCQDVDDGLQIVGQHNVIHDLVAVANSDDPGRGVELFGSRNRLVDAVLVGFERGVYAGINIGGGASLNEGAHTLQRVRAFNSTDVGIWLAAPNNRLVEVMTSGSANVGISIQHDSNVVIDAVSILTGAEGVIVGGDGVVIANLVSLANRSGLIVSFSEDFVLRDAVLAHNELLGLSASNSTLSAGGTLVVGANGSGDCGLNSSEANLSAVDGSCVAVDESVLIVEGVDLVGHLLGEQPDGVNLSDDENGRALYDDITDWSSLDHNHRVWGPAATGGEVFPDPAVRGACGPSDTCQIYDLTPALATDPNDLLDVIGTPSADELWVHTWSAGNQTECNVVGGSWDMPSTTCSREIHLLGVETDQVDGEAGNGNGVCEAAEPCVNARNYGAYQGHGVIAVTPGDFDFGASGTYQFYGYGENGR